MQTEPQAASNPKWMTWAGWIVSILPALALIASAVFKFLKSAEVVEGMAKLGWTEDLALGLGIVELGCTLIYLFPSTCVLGAILLTGYLGGAVATHVRIGDQFVAPIIIGVLVWGGLWLREPRLRALVPWRSS